MSINPIQYSNNISISIIYFTRFLLQYFRYKVIKKVDPNRWIELTRKCTMHIRYVVFFCNMVNIFFTKKSIYWLPFPVNFVSHHFCVVSLFFFSDDRFISKYLLSLPTFLEIIYYKCYFIFACNFTRRSAFNSGELGILLTLFWQFFRFFVENEQLK